MLSAAASKVPWFASVFLALGSGVRRVKALLISWRSFVLGLFFTRQSYQIFQKQVWLLDGPDIFQRTVFNLCRVLIEYDGLRETDLSCFQALNANIVAVLEFWRQAFQPHAMANEGLIAWLELVQYSPHLHFSGWPRPVLPR